jgi:hypothetical protein
MGKIDNNWSAGRILTLLLFIKRRPGPSGGAHMGYSLKSGCRIELKKRKDYQAGMCRLA